MVGFQHARVRDSPWNSTCLKAKCASWYQRRPGQQRECRSKSEGKPGSGPERCPSHTAPPRGSDSSLELQCTSDRTIRHWNSCLTPFVGTSNVKALERWVPRFSVPVSRARGFERGV
eukprot:3680608-Rhodomonas_salina.5